MPHFAMTMEIDPNGVIVAVFEGEFIAPEYMRQRQQTFESRHSPADYDGRPMVTDIRRCALPQRNWAEQFQDVAHFLKQRRRKPFRHAIVIGEEPGSETAVALFAEYQRIFHHPEVDTRAFEDFEDAYAWALEGLRPPDAPDSAGDGDPRDSADRHPNLRCD